ncbi:MAG TPA: PilZ domain-containing protein [Candidatus Xenobia bacterium]|jgi:hypothetical protein
MTLESSTPAAVAEPVDLEITRREQFNLTFRTTVVFPVKAHVWMVAHPRDGSTEFPLEVTLVSSYVLSDDRVEYAGKLDHAPAGFGAWEGQIFLRDHPSKDGLKHEADAPTPESDQRRGRRLVRTFQVTSRHLSRYKALSSDISDTGLRLMAEESLPVGKVVDLTLDFDDFRYPHMKAQGEVVWARPRDSRTFWIGLKFVGMSEADQAIVAEYISFCVRRKTGALERPATDD